MPAIALGVIAAGSAVAGGIFSALGGSAQRRLAEQQARLLMEQAKQGRLASDVQKTRIRYIGRRAMGSHIASAGAGGVAISGSVADRAADIQSQIDEDLVITEYNSQLQTDQLRTQAGIVRAGGRMAERASQVGGGLSALGGVTRAGVYYYGNIAGVSQSSDVFTLGPSMNWGITMPPTRG